METIDQTSVKINIQGIELLEYSIVSSEKTLPETMEYKFDIAVEHKIALDQKKIFVITSIRIYNEEMDFNPGNIKVGCIFELPEIDKFVSANKQIDIPEPILTTLNSITFSTVRGVMFTLFKGTFLHNVILPIIDPKTLVNGKK